MNPINGISNLVKATINPSPPDASDSNFNSGIAERLTVLRTPTEIARENSPPKFQYAGVGSSPASGAASPREYEYAGVGSSPASGAASPKEYEYAGVGSSPASGAASPREYEYAGVGSSPASGAASPSELEPKPENPRQADRAQEKLDQEVAEAEARVIAAGDNYDLLHLINPRTGNEYTDAEVKGIQDNGADAFRAGLSPTEQRAYDRWLDEVKNDGTVEFEIDPNIDQRANQIELDDNMNLALRGIAAASFGDQETHRELFSDDPYVIEFLEGVPTVSVTDPNTGTATQVPVGAIADPTNKRITIQYEEAQSRADNNSTQNVFAHEYVHLIQTSNPVPPTVPNAAEESLELNRIFTEAREGSTPEGRNLARFLDAEFPPTLDPADPTIVLEPRGVERWVRGADDANAGFINAEPYAVAAGFFYQSPQELQNASPELYELMVRTTGNDPLAS